MSAGRYEVRPLDVDVACLPYRPGDGQDKVRLALAPPGTSSTLPIMYVRLTPTQARKLADELTWAAGFAEHRFSIVDGA